MPTTPITNETTLNAAIAAGNTATAAAPETGVFPTSGGVAETAAPTAITAAAGDLTLQGNGSLLTGDGTDAALILAAGGNVTIEGLGITNTGAAASISLAAGSVVTFEGESDGDGGSYASVIDAPVTGAGAVHIGSAADLTTAPGTAATVVLNAASTYTGSTVIYDGALELGVNGTGATAIAGSIAASSNVSLKGADATLDVSGLTADATAPATTTINELTGTGGTVNLGATHLVVNEGVAAATFAGDITGTGAVTFGGADALTLTGDNTYTGSTIVTGDLALSGAGSVADSSNVSLKASGATFDVSGSEGGVSINELTGVAGSHVVLGANTLTVTETTTTVSGQAVTDLSFSGVISGQGGLTLTAGEGVGATLTLNGVNTYTGATTVEEGATLQVGLNGSISASSEVFVDGTLDLSQSQSATGAAVSVAINNLNDDGDGIGTVILGHNTLVVTTTTGDEGSSTVGGESYFAGDITGSPASGGAGGGLTVTAGSDFSLAGVNDYAGSTKIYGELDLYANDAIAASSNVALKQAGAELYVEGSNTINELTGVAGTTVYLDDANLTVNENVVSASFSGDITGNGSVVVEGSDTLTLAGANSFTGGLTVDDGASVVLSGVNTYTGGTMVGYDATLTVAAGGTLGTGNLVVDGTLDVSAATGAVAVTNLSSGAVEGPFVSDIMVTAPSVNIGANKLVDATTATEDFSGVISGTGSLQVGTAAGTGELILTGDSAQAYTGSTIIYSHLAVDGGSIENSSNVALKAAGAVLDLSDADTTGTFTETLPTYNYVSDTVNTIAATYEGVLINELSGVAGASVVIGEQTLIVNETANASFGGVISDDGNGATDGQYTGDQDDGVSLVVRGSGTLTLTGASTYHGDTVIKGHLDLAAGGSIANSFVSDYGVFDISAATGGSTDAFGNSVVAIQGLQGGNANATVVLGDNTLDITGSPYNNYVETSGGYGYSHSGFFEGVISGTGGLEVSETTGEESAYLGLTNASTYTGATTIGSGAEIELLGTGSIASTSAIVDNGEFAIDEAGFTLSQVVSGTGELDVYQAYDVTTGAASAGSVTITAAETYTGETYVSAGATLIIGAGGSIAGTSEVYLSDEGEGSTAATAGVFDISNAGGNVTIGSLGGDDGSAVVLGSNSLIITKGTEDFSGVISGAGGVQITANGGVYIGEAQTYTGSTVVTGFLGLYDAATSLASSNVSLKGTGAFDVSDVEGTVTINELTGQSGTHVYLGESTLVVTETVAATYAGVISDGGEDDGSFGSLTVDGSAYLTLTGVNTYTGETTVNGDLALGAGGSIADSSGLVDDGFFAISANTTVSDLSGTGVVKMVGNTLTVDETSATTFSGTIHGAGVLAVEGGETLTLSGSTSDYSGGTTVTGAGTTLDLTGLHAAGSGAITLGAGTTLEIANSALTNGGTAAESFANLLHLTAGTTAGTAPIVDLTDLSFVTAGNAAETFTVGTGGALTVTEGNVSVTFATDLAAGTTVTALSDSHGGTAFHANLMPA